MSNPRRNALPTQAPLIGALACGVTLACCAGAQAQTTDPALNALVKKGILTEQEAKEALADAQKNAVTQAPPSALKWKINDAIKDITLFGDIRLRYENRNAANAFGSGALANRFYRDRFRYALRVGIKGELKDDFYYGLRVETSANPRSTWVTFGDDSNSAPFAKNSDGINLGQAYVGWRGVDWLEVTVGKMPMPLYVTSLLWDGDLNPEGAFEKFKYSVGHVDLFAGFGQFIYKDFNPDDVSISGDPFLLAWQIGATAKLATNLTFKIAPVLYNYTGGNQGTFAGEGLTGLNVANGLGVGAFDQTGINNLLVLEVPAEFNFKLGPVKTRFFGDFAYNLNGEDRARAAAAAAHLPRAYTDETKAYLAGLAFGDVSKKHGYELRTWWQAVEQYATDVNLLDSDFFEGRGNIQGVGAGFAYAITDAIVGTVRYGYAERLNRNLGTGGSNHDLPGLNPVRSYHILQLDLTYRF